MFSALFRCEIDVTPFMSTPETHRYRTFPLDGDCCEYWRQRLRRLENCNKIEFMGCFTSAVFESRRLHHKQHRRHHRVQRDGVYGKKVNLQLKRSGAEKSLEFNVIMAQNR